MKQCRSVSYDYGRVLLYVSAIIVTCCGCCIPCIESTMNIIDDEGCGQACKCEAICCNSDLHECMGFTWSRSATKSFRVDFAHALRANAFIGIATVGRNTKPNADQASPGLGVGERAGGNRGARATRMDGG